MIRIRLPTSQWALLAAAIPVLAFGIFASLFLLIGGVGRHLVGLAVALFLLTIPIGVMLGEIQSLRIYEASADTSAPFVDYWSTTIWSLTAALLLLCIFAEVSLALSAWQLASFSPSERPATYPDMLATYAWFLMDLVPFMDPARTFGMTEPRLRPQGLIAGAPVLAFKAIIGIYALDVLRRAWILYRHRSTQQFLQRLADSCREDR
jgi:hypothetical protein